MADEPITPPRRAWWAYPALTFAVGWAWAVWWLVWMTGDRWWFGTVILFSPRWLLLLPTFASLVLLRWVGWRARGFFVLVGAVACAGALGFCVPWSSWHPKRVIMYRVLSCNVAGWAGGSGGLKRLIYETRADIILLQEYNDQEHLSIPEDWFQCREDGLMIASRFPLSKVHSVKSQGRWPRARGLFCEIETLEQTLPLCNLHFTSPRHGLTTVLDAQTILAPSRRKLLLKQTEQRESESLRLSEAALQPDGAMVVAGDFNMPVESHFFREHWKGFRDAFSETGFGFGHTTHVSAAGRISFGARIDHVLTRGNWHARRCWVAFDVGSDHLPLLADVYWSE